jgi:predicted nucleic acid-binding protein
MMFADANIFLRALAADDPTKFNACTDLLRRVDRGEVEITTCEAILTEVVYVLSSRATYGLSHEEIRARLAPLIRMRGLRLSRKHLYLQALDLFATHATLDFEDALCVVHMQQLGISEILSYDRDFDRIAVVQRIEP